MKKLPPGNFISLKTYEFSAPKPQAEETTAFSPTLPYKKTEKEEIKPKPIIKSIKRKVSEVSISSSNSEAYIKPNYPKPVIRNEEIKKEKTVAEILFEYQVDLQPDSMMPLQSTIKPNILQSIRQRPFSAGAKMMDVYNTGKAKTIQEIRTREKFKGKADAAVNVWLEKLASENMKSTKIAEENIKRFKRSEDKLSSEISQIMNKIRSTKVENQKALSNLQSKIASSKADVEEFVLPKSCFTLYGKPVNEPDAVNTKNLYETQVKVYNSNPSKQQPPAIITKKEEIINIISDDDSFLKDISSPEDFEVLSEDDNL